MVMEFLLVSSIYPHKKALYTDNDPFSPRPCFSDFK